MSQRDAVSILSSYYKCYEKWSRFAVGSWQKRASIKFKAMGLVERDRCLVAESGIGHGIRIVRALKIMDDER